MDFSGIGEPGCLYYEKPQSRPADNSGSKTGTFLFSNYPETVTSGQWRPRWSAQLVWRDRPRGCTFYQISLAFSNQPASRYIS